LPVGVEENSIFLRIVRLSNAQTVGKRLVAHSLASRRQVLHVDVLPMRFPDDLGQRLWPIALHDGEYSIAVHVVAADGYLREIGATQVVERRGNVRAHRAV
jgi:hypothetical protein